MFEMKKIEVTRKCACGACGLDVVRGDDRIQAVMPWQNRGVNYHEECLKNFKYNENIPRKERTSIGNSTNCKNHTVTIKNCTPILFQYFIHYGFEPTNKGGSTVWGTFDNAESIGSTLKTAFNNNLEVFVNGRKVDSLEEYDAKTKAVCMR